MIKDYQKKVKLELRSICTTVLKLLDKYLVAIEMAEQARVSYMSQQHVRRENTNLF